MGGVWWQGIDIEEIGAACKLLEIPPDRLAGITLDVRFMGRVVANARNERAAREAKSKSGGRG